MTPDPLAEKYPWVSPYVYCLNNPMKFIDPDGRQVFVPFFGVNPVMMGSSTPLLGAADPIKVGVETTGRVATETGGRLPKAENHHIIPRSVKDNPVVEAARDAGFKLEGKENKISVEKFSRQTGEGQHGKHPDYTTGVREKLNEASRKNPNMTGEEAVNAVRGTVKEIKETIQNNPDTKINDLFKVEVAPTDAIKSYVPQVVEPVVPPKQNLIFY